MKFTVQQADLLRELGLARGAVDEKAMIPILSSFLLRAKKDRLEVAATDMELGIQGSCEAKVAVEGEVAINAGKLHDVVRALPDDAVHFALQKANRVQIRCAGTEYRVLAQGTEDFPPLREHAFKGALAMPLATLKTMVARVIFAVTQDDPRYAVYGALLVIGKGRVEMVATDGHRLARVAHEMPTPKGETRVIVPVKALAQVLALEPGPEGEVRVGFEDRVFFRSGARVVQSSLFDGEFPAYDQIIPDNKKVFRCSTEGLLSVLRRVSVVLSEKVKAVNVTIDKGRMTISTQNPEFGDAEGSVAVGYKGAPLEVGFNARYLMDFLEVVGTAEVQVELGGAEVPGLLRPVGEKVDYVYVVVPMRLL